MIGPFNTVILNGNGVITKPGAAEDDPPVTLSGRHAQTVESVMVDHPELEPYRVTPANPLFEIVGADNVCLRFASEAEMYAALPTMAPEIGE